MGCISFLTCLCQTLRSVAFCTRVFQSSPSRDRFSCSCSVLEAAGFLQAIFVFRRGLLLAPEDKTTLCNIYISYTRLDCNIAEHAILAFGMEVLHGEYASASL